MDPNGSFDDDFNFRSRDWYILKPKLEADLLQVYQRITSAQCQPSEADQLRGRASYIRELLATEQSALKKQAR